MKFLYTFISLLIFIPMAQAEPMSKCHFSCFEHKYQCNIDKSHLINNSCGKELAECRLKCGSKNGKDLFVSTAFSPFDITF